MRALIALLIVPLMLLSLLGGIVSGIWLAILGQWWAIGYGVAGLFLTFILGLIQMPGLLFGIPAVLLLERRRTVLAFPFILLSQLYTYAVVTAWCMLVFYLFISRASQDSFWPLLIWSYGVALGPWMFLAEKDQQADPDAPATFTTFFAQISYIVTALVVILDGVPLLTLTMIFGGVMLIGMLIQTAVEFTKLRLEKALGNASDQFGVDQ